MIAAGDQPHCFVIHDGDSVFSSGVDQQPWTALVPMKRTSERLYEFACHEGNAEIMHGMLGAARADEKAAEEAAKKKAK